MNATVGNLTETERAKYDAQWRETWYREKCHGLAVWNDHRGLFPKDINTAIDIGCGTGRLVKAWRALGIEAHGFDISTEAADADIALHVHIGTIWEMTTLLPYEVAVCADVMEHIPPDKVRASIAAISRCCDMCVFKIANFPSHGVDGSVLHLTLQPREWWRQQLEAFGEVEFIPTKTGAEEYLFRVTF